MTWGSVITVMTPRLSEHREHSRTSSSNTRRIKSTQHRTLSRRGARSWRSASALAGSDGVGGG
jgi:hypothetical protein